ncbi:unnamed protein product [Jaminaea pallidilutea]
MSRPDRPARTSSTSGRIVQRLALRGTAHAWGARYQLFLHVCVPHSNGLQTFQLFPDANVKLVGSVIDPLSSTGAFGPLSETALRAAKLLGLPAQVDTNLQQAPNGARVTVSDYSIALSVPPSSHGGYFESKIPAPASGSSSPPSRPSSSSYLVTLYLEAPLLSQPPRSSYAVRLPIPRCLRSRARFTFSSEVIADDGETDIRVEPPLGKSRRQSRRSAADTSSFDVSSSGGSSQLADDDDAKSTFSHSDGGAEEGEADDLSVHGFFTSSESLLIRWAPAGAGKLNPEDDLSVLRCDHLHLQTHSRYSLDEVEDSARVDILVKGSLDGCYCAGMDRIAYFPLILDTVEQEVDCQDISLEVSPGLRSWVFLQPGDVPRKHLARSTSRSTLASSADSVNASMADDTSSLEGDDLISVRPPRGIDSSLDLTAEFTGMLNGNGKETNGGDRSESSQRPLLGPGEQERILLYIEVPKVCPEGSATSIFSFTLRYALSMRIVAGESVPLPNLTAPAASRLIVHHTIEPHTEPIALRPTQDGQSFSSDASTRLAYEYELSDDHQGSHCQLVRSPPQLETLSDETLATTDTSLQTVSQAVSRSLYRPTAIYDAIELADDASIKPSLLADVHVTLWLCSKGRLVGEINSSWPLAASTGETLDEMDVWLPRVSGQADPLVRLAQLDGIQLRYTQSDAADSLCIHFRKPNSSLPASQLGSPLSQRFSCVFEYACVAKTATEARTEKADPRINAPEDLTIRTPLFAQEVVALHLALHYDGSAIDRIVAPNFDLVQVSNDRNSGQAHAHSFGVSPLTPLSLLAVPRSPTSAATQRPNRRLVPRWLSFAVITSLSAVLILSLAGLSTSLQAQTLEIEALHRRVEQLGLATDVDFSDGSWRPEDTPLDQTSRRTAGMAFEDDRDDDAALFATASASDQTHDPASFADTKRNPTTTALSLRPSPQAPVSLSLVETGAIHHILRAFAWPILVVGRGASVLLTVTARLFHLA